MCWAFGSERCDYPALPSIRMQFSQLTPEERMNEGMSLVDAGLVGGQAIGLSTSGVIAAHYGGTTGFFIVSAAGLLTLLVATGGALV